MPVKASSQVVTRWNITLPDGTRLGTVRAATYEEAIELATQLVARAGKAR